MRYIRRMSGPGDDFVDFADLKFDGGRYERPGYPLSALSELMRYERLLVDVAKVLWRKAHPDRQRLSRGMEEAWKLRLVRVDPGSVDPLLIREREPLADSGDDYLDEAKRLIDEVFESVVAGNDLPADFPEDATPALLMIGSTLRATEKLKFRASTNSVVTYDQRTRGRFIRRLTQKPYEVVGTIIGKVTAVDTDSRTFSLHVSEGHVIVGKFSDAAFSDDLIAVTKLYDEADIVRLEATALIGLDDEVVGLADAWEVEVFSPSHDATGLRLLELAELREGWLDGEGAAIEFMALELARDICASPNLALVPPAIFPTDDGGVQLEWIASPNVHLSLEIDPSGVLEGYLADVGARDSASREFVDVDSAADWLAEWLERAHG